MTGRRELKTFAISGWVQEEVYTYVKARNLKEVERFLKRNAGDLNSKLHFEEGNWASGVTIDEDPKEVEGREANGFPCVTDITEKED